MKINKLLISALVAAGAFGGASAQDEGTVIFDLTQQANFTACKQVSLRYDRNASDAWMWSSYRSCPELYYYNYNEPYYDDYLVTPELELKKGHRYVISTFAFCETNNKNTNLHLYYGQGELTEVSNYEPNYSLIETLLLPYSYVDDSKEKTAEFMVDEDGMYKVAFRGEPNRMYLYKTKIIEYGPSTVPAQVTDFSVTPDSDGASKVTISFTLPSTTATGQDLTAENLSYNIYRDDEIINSGNANGGTPVVYTDEEVTPGEVTYAIEVVRGEDKTERLSVTTFVGVETPNPVANLILAGKSGEYKLTWDAPTTGIHNASLDASKLSYEISRIVNEVEETIASDISATEYEDDFVSDEIVALSYKVVTKYGEKSSEPAISNSMTVGSLSLPFQDSFAGAQIDPLKWENERVSGSYDWEAAAKVGSSVSNLTADAYDGDGGLAYFNFYSANTPAGARLMTMPISKASSTSPVIEFYLWRYGRKQDKIKLQIQVDGGEWQDIEGAEYVNTRGENDPEPDENGWYNYKVGYGSYLPEDCSTYRLSFTAVSDYGYNMAIDAVRIFNVAGADLGVALSAPELVVAGNNLELTLKVSNNGADVSAEDYSIEIESDFPVEIPVETVDISSLSSAQIKVSVPVTAEEALNTDSYIFKAVVTYDADEVADNNESDTVEVATAFSEFDAPKNVVASVSEDEEPEITISWDSAKDLTYTPVNIIETFNDLEKGSQANFNGWVSIDLDKQAGSYYYNIDSSEFTVTNGATPKGGDGNYIGLTTKSGSQEDDWLISPEINCKAGSVMNFSAKVAVRNVSSSYNIRLSLLYSEDEYDIEDPAASFKELKSWTSSTYGPLYQNDTFCAIDYEGIPSTAKYLALHFDTKTNYDMAIWVDDLKIFEVDNTPLLGYHVYERNAGRLNEEALTPETLEHTVVDKARDMVSRSFYVTAIYPDGESEPSNLATIDVEAEVEQILASGSNISAVSGGVMVSGHNGETAEVYTLDGRKAASMRCADITVINLNAGIYIVKVGKETAKVVVK